MGARGSGKTYVGSNWLLESALSRPDSYWAVCAPTFRDVKRICLDGKSGIIRQAEPGDIVDYNKNNLVVTLRNGAVVRGFSAEKPESVRGENLSGCWLDELCSIEKEEFYHDALMPALREDDARLLITTTPSRTRIIRDLVRQAQDPKFHIHITRAASRENPYFAPRRLLELETRYKGTRLYRQELLGELIEDVAGAAFDQDIIDACRLRPDDVPGSLVKTAVAIDPAMSSRPGSDESGIIVAAAGEDGHIYVLADLSRRGTPDDIMRAAAAAFHDYRATHLVCEKNQGGDYLDNALKHVDPNLRLTKIHAMKGKFIRCQPASMLYQQGRVHHCNSAAYFEVLEAQLTAMVAEEDRSSKHDDHADALIYAVEALDVSQASWLAAYGMTRCEHCDASLFAKAASCPECGRAREPDKPAERAASGRAEWADVYRPRDRRPAIVQQAAMIAQWGQGNFTGGNPLSTPGLARIWRKGWQ